MLKLTHSSYRCLKPTCDDFSYRISHLRAFSYLSCTTKTCRSVFRQNSLVIPFFHKNDLLRWLLVSKRKRFYTKKPFTNSNAEKTFESMSDPFQPSLNHVSCGGKFNIVTENESDSWIHFNESGSRAHDNLSKKAEIPPDFRIWEHVGKWDDPCNGNSFKFKIVSYNVLAQCLLEYHPYLYTQCASRHLKWKERAKHLYTEILSLEPDILCLQEVQASHVSSFYSKFEEIGYCGVFKQKTGRREDGCAIYFKRSMFHLEDHMSVEFYQPELPLLNRDNVGVALRLVPRDERAARTPLVVATTHLLYNPKRTDVRLAQMQLFLAEIDYFAYYRDGTRSGHYPIILTGDLNSPPDSAVVQLLGRGHVCAAPFRDNSDWRRIGVTDNCQHLSVYLSRLKGVAADSTFVKSGRHEGAGGAGGRYGGAGGAGEHGALFNGGALAHALRFASVYGQRKPDGAREATTFQDYWLTVDYIYFSALRLLERLRLPTEAECEQMGPLPNNVYASDHLALAAVFELKSLGVNE